MGKLATVAPILLGGVGDILPKYIISTIIFHLVGDLKERGGGGFRGGGVVSPPILFKPIFFSDFYQIASVAQSVER